MSQFTSTLAELHTQLTRRFDHILQLKNTPALTVDSDAHYAIFRLAQLVATEFPSAEQELSWSRESITYSLPYTWQDINPHWLVECPSLVASYDEVLQAPDANVVVSSDSAALLVERQFIVDSTVARVFIRSQLPPEDFGLLQSLGKVTTEVEPEYTRTVLSC